MKINTKEILDIDHTICKDLFLDDYEVWELIPKIKEYIIKLGNNLDKTKYNKLADDIWVSKSANISTTAHIDGPCIIDDNTEIRHCAYIRGGVVVGKNCVIGNSCELKNVIIFDNCQIPHFNYMGDSIMGYHSHIGAGVIVTNLKSDKTSVTIKNNGEEIITGLRKMGGIIGNYVEVGCNSTIFPGTIIYPNTNVYPLTRVRGVIKSNSIVKSEKEIIRKEER